MLDPLGSSACCQHSSSISRPDLSFCCAGDCEVYVDLGIDSRQEGVIEDFHSSPAIGYCSELELELAGTLSSADPSPRSHHAHRRHRRHIMLREDNNYDCSRDMAGAGVGARTEVETDAGGGHDLQLCWGLMIAGGAHTSVSTGRCIASSGNDDNDADHQEEGQSATSVGSLWGIHNDGATMTGMGNPNYGFSNASGASPEIECFDAADISAACQLLEMSTSHFGGVRLTEHQSTQEQQQQQVEHDIVQKQEDSLKWNVRVCDTYDYSSTDAFPSASASASASVSDPAAPLETTNSSTLTDASARDDELGTGAGQERSRRATSNSSGSTTVAREHSPRMEQLRPYGKKRVKPKKGGPGVLGTNPNVSADDNYDILDRPSKKRNFKSLRKLLELK